MITNNLSLYGQGDSQDTQKHLWTTDLEAALNKQIELVLEEPYTGMIFTAHSVALFGTLFETELYEKL